MADYFILPWLFVRLDGDRRAGFPMAMVEPLVGLRHGIRHLVDQATADRRRFVVRVRGFPAGGSRTIVTMQLKTERCILRPFTTGDRDALAEIANDRRISRNLTDRFPYPYTIEDANEWIEFASGQQPVRNFAIEVGGSLVGGIGVEPMEGEKQHVAAVGYWLSPENWGQGLATEALSVLIDYVEANFPHIRRFQASVYDWNPASGRVLEKCGFHREATLRGAIVKDGDVTDEHIYVRTLG